MAFRFCPACGSSAIVFEQEKRYRCPACGLEYFHNVASAVGVFLVSDDRLVLIVRAAEPARGKLALPGGFIDPGERAEDAVRRECREEIGWEPDSIDFLASYPNRYEYRGFLYNTCDFFFVARKNGLSEADFHIDPAEAAGLAFVHIHDVDPRKFAFDSARKAFAAFAECARGKS